MLVCVTVGRSFKFVNRLLLCRKDVRLPVQLQRAMAAEAEATREARAKVCYTLYTRWAKNGSL